MATKKTKKVQYLGTGRRKTAIARVRLIPGGEGANILVNDAPSNAQALEGMPCKPMKIRIENAR